MKYLLIIISSFFIFSSCTKEEKYFGPSRTVLIYMSSDAGLANFTSNNIRALQTATSSYDLKNNKLLVYVNRPRVSPVLVQIYNGTADTIKTYDSSQSSGTKEVLAEIINEVRQNHQSDSYGLLLWGHGMNWLPKTVSSSFRSEGGERGNLVATPSRPTTRFYGYDKNANVIDLNDFHDVIPEGMFDYILFDACYMGSIEVAYTLRNKAKYIVSSAAEIWDLGFPYKDIVATLYATNTEDGLRSLCTTFYNYYATGEASISHDQSATISLVSTTELSQLAEVSRIIFQETKTNAEMLSLANIQRFDRKSAFYRPALISYDMRDYISNLGDAQLLNMFDSVFDKVVLYEKHTDTLFKYFSDGFDVRTHCGLTLYPYYTLNKTLPELDPYYRQLDWYKAVYE